MDPHHHEPCWLIVLGRSGPGDCQDQSSDIRGCTSVLPRSEEEATARSETPVTIFPEPFQRHAFKNPQPDPSMSQEVFRLKSSPSKRSEKMKQRCT
ncbi:hypothetical protein Y1Q_0000578 [Alligator mississippiensis]|uniref:Uncharacterized protein n=1 Tax=Alligator mississippiensis TaxID=8496 RepID=A0A151MBR7_ALLMI|nr:hypothetical protein Y1Q_0000578 [Alligator mississippiensis]